MLQIYTTSSRISSHFNYILLASVLNKTKYHLFAPFPLHKQQLLPEFQDTQNFSSCPEAKQSEKREAFSSVDISSFSPEKLGAQNNTQDTTLKPIINQNIVVNPFGRPIFGKRG
jgi:hypothetical protein